MKAHIHKRQASIGFEIDLILSDDGKPERWRNIGGAENRANAEAIARAVGAALLLAGYSVTGA